jgi:hypothetical protein
MIMNQAVPLTSRALSLSRSVALVAVGLSLFGLGQGAVTVSSYSKLIEEARYVKFTIPLLENIV